MKGNGHRSNGPDWQDIAMMVRELEALHNVTVRSYFASDAARYAGTLRVVVEARAPILTGPGQTWKGECWADWPNNQSRTMEGLVFRLLHQLDSLISAELWRQEQFT